jgi:hypothetical protein
MSAGRRTSGADGPDRLICDDELRGSFTVGAKRSDVGRHLTGDDRLGVACEVLRLALTDAEHDAQPRGDRARELSRDTGVVISEITADLGVPDDRPPGDAREHRDRDLPRIRALVLPWTSCANTLTCVPRRASATAASAIAGGATATPTPPDGTADTTARASATASAMVGGFIFQLPTTRRVLVIARPRP